MYVSELILILLAPWLFSHWLTSIFVYLDMAVMFLKLTRAPSIPSFYLDGILGNSWFIFIPTLDDLLQV